MTLTQRQGLSCCYQAKEHPVKRQHWTIGEAAGKANISVRTLHHYDEIGLLTPTERSEGGYRLYGRADMRRLQSILLYRELGFSLEGIRVLLDSNAFQRAESLKAQRALLRERMEETERIIQVLDAELEKNEESIDQKTEAVMENPYADEAKERWGHTEAYKESMRRTKRYTKDDWAQIQAEGEEIEARFAELLKAGVAQESDEATETADAHREHISKWFYPCDKEIHVGLGEMYVADPRFTAHYDRRAEGLAAYVSAAIKANAKR